MSTNFAWNKNFDLQIPSINEEHKEIFARMAQIENLSKNFADKKAVLAAFDNLVEYTLEHFQSEEAFMRKINFPEIETHKKMHADLMAKLDKYRKEYVNSVYGAFPSSVFDFFQNWLLTHILIADKRYAEFAKSKATS